MDFTTDIFTLYAPTNKKFNLVGTMLPSNRDVYFRAKQKELVDQYATARVFLRETDTVDWKHWFNPHEEERFNKVFQLIFMGQFYEAALMYYNIIIDLSWTLVYVSVEYVYYEKETAFEFADVISIEDAYNRLRKAENTVTNPTAEGNPLGYLKNMCPEFQSVIELVLEFWGDFHNTEIRKNYNYVKHKGKPLYSEIKDFDRTRLFSMYVGKDKNIQVPTEISDVQKEISMIASIDELKEFDDNTLFPYIEKILNELEKIMNVSPFI